MGGSDCTVRGWSAEDRAALDEALRSRGAERAESPPRSFASQKLDRLLEQDLVGRVACDAEGVPVAFVLARHETVALGTEEVRWLRLVHVCNAHIAGGLDRARPTLAAARSFLQELCGPSPDASPLVYGWPSRRFFRLAYYHLKAEVVRNQNQLRLVVADFQGTQAGASVEVVENFPEEVDELFQRVRSENTALRDRSSKALNARFSRFGTEKIAVARSGQGGVIGYAVHRQGIYDGQETELLVDWLEAPEEPSAGPALRAYVAESTQAKTVTMLLPDSCPGWRAFQNSGFRVHPTNDFLMVRSFQRPHDATWLERHWYYTLSDFED